jgi:hypothetical protein
MEKTGREKEQRGRKGKAREVGDDADVGAGDPGGGYKVHAPQRRRLSTLRGPRRPAAGTQRPATGGPRPAHGRGLSRRRAREREGAESVAATSRVLREARI